MNCFEREIERNLKNQNKMKQRFQAVWFTKQREEQVKDLSQLGLVPKRVLIVISNRRGCQSPPPGRERPVARMFPLKDKYNVIVSRIFQKRREGTRTFQTNVNIQWCGSAARRKIYSPESSLAMYPHTRSCKISKVLTTQSCLVHDSAVQNQPKKDWSCNFACKSFKRNLKESLHFRIFTCRLLTMQSRADKCNKSR